MRKSLKHLKSVISFVLALACLISCIGIDYNSLSVKAQKRRVGSDVYINGVKAAPSGEGYTYSDVTNKLTLKGFTALGEITSVEGINASIYSTGDLTIELSGENVIDNGGDYGIYCKGNLTFSGSGSLDVKGGKGITLDKTSPKLSVEGGELDITGTTAYALESKSGGANLTIKNTGSIKALGAGVALAGFTSYTLPGNILVKEGDDEASAKEVSGYSGKRYMSAKVDGYIVQFNDGNSIIKTQRYQNGAYYTGLPTPADRSNVGYSFDAWYTASNGGDKIKENISTVDGAKAVDGCIVVYAHWNAIDYTVTLQPNGGSVTPTAIQVNVEKKYNDLPTPERADYSFLGWFTAANGGNKVEKTSNLVNYGNHSLYAHWAEKTYEVTLNVNGGNSVSPAKLNVVYGKAYGTLPNATRTGYAFDGWFTDVAGGSQVVSSTIVNRKENHTLFAHWSEKKKWIITLNANGGKLTSGQERKEVYQGDKYGDLPTPTKDNYVFQGWFTANNGGTQVTKDTVVNLNANQTLYAHWEELKYTVTLNPNGGKVNPTSITVKPNATYGTLPTPTRDGYKFEGWFTAINGGTQVTATTKYELKGNQTLYAHWIANTYDVTFDPNGGKTSYGTKKVTVGQKYGELPVATRDGYTFAGWYTQSTGGNLITKDSVVAITANTTLFAHWTGSKITVTFNTLGGTSSVPNKVVVTGDMYGELPTANRTGYIFEGWYTEATGGTAVTSTTVVTAITNHILYAHWKGNSFLVTFDPNGGDTDFTTKPVEYGLTYGELPKATRRYYKFSGWYTDRTGGVKVTASSTVNLTTTQVLYAHWKKVVVGSVSDVELVGRKGGFKLMFECPSNASGNEIRFSTSANMNNDKRVTTKGRTLTKTGLRNNKVYYVQVRSFRYDSQGKRVYGKWSEIMVVRTK